MSKIQIRPRPFMTPLSSFDRYPAYIARILAARGVQSSAQLDLSLKHLLAPKLKDIDQAVELINQNIEQAKHIVIVGDYDADGATSTALMVLALKQMGARVDYLVPDRFKYGYGLTALIAELAFERYQPDLLITVDNGISSHEGVERAKQLGMQVIITDHHLSTKAPPLAHAVVNPNQVGCEFGSKALAGVGVAFYVLAHLASLRQQQGRTSVKMSQYLDLVALGTYADVASLDYNNRILIAAGLKRIQQRQCRAGILAILEIAQKPPERLTAQDLGFVIGPRLNAAGRMDSMNIGIECLLASDFAQAYPIAERLNQLNLERREVETKMKQQALDLLMPLKFENEQLPPALVLFEPNWHQGVIGIVAGRLKEQFYRPSIVFAPDEDGVHLKGSARSIDGVHIRDAIEQVAEKYPDIIKHFGGHAAAAGLTLKKECFESFKTHFIAQIALSDPELFESVVYTDGALEPEALSLDGFAQIEALGPWGQKFPYPQFEGIFQILDYRWIKDSHLKLTLAAGNGSSVEAIAFQAAQRFDFNPNATHVQLVYSLERNEYRGVQSLQLRIVALQHPT